MKFSLRNGGRMMALAAGILLASLCGFPTFANETSPPMKPYLIPQPVQANWSTGTFQIEDRTRIFLPAGIQRPELLAAMRLEEQLRAATGVDAMLDRLGKGPADVERAIFFEIASPAETDPVRAQGYRLSITPQEIRLVGNGHEGLFNGIQTLAQMITQCGAAIPAVEIEDSPAFRYRGFYHDISRGKVPTLETMKWLVDELAAMKVNMFQLYVEHPFEFRFDPDIAQGMDALTPEEVLILDEYCRDRRIDFVPSLQSFGHMGGVFSLPKYKHLAEVEIETWDKLDWHQRMVGATIDMKNPEALALLEKMHDEFLPLFESEFVNMCADETYALGKGKNKEAAEAAGGSHQLYLEHIKNLNDLARRYDKRLMIWGDIVLEKPEVIPSIPKDVILMNWGYWAKTDYTKTRHFAEAGLDFFVCPGTSGWNRITNQVNNATRNIRDFAAAGKQYGAIGFLNTDWGDHGHYNLLSTSLHGIALGGAMGWNPDAPSVEEFDAAWNRLTFGIDDGAAVQALRDQSILHDYLGTWVQLYQPIESTRFWETMKPELAEELVESGTNGARVFEEYAAKATSNRWAAEELAHASQMNAMLGRKFQLLSERKEKGMSPELSKKMEAYADQLDQMRSKYRELWLARNKETDLKAIEQKLEALAEEFRKAAHQG